MKSSRIARWGLVAITLLIGAGTSAAPPATNPAPAAGGGDAPSDRLTFLLLRLSSAEESIKALNAAMKAAGYKAFLAENKVDSYQKGNENMDRNGGGPVRWDEFYGRTARDFYIPDTEGTYHASSHGSFRSGGVAAQSSSERDAHVVSGNHPINRPKQFDYIYRANNEQAAKAKADVASMGQKIDALVARRRKIEAEQSALWATIALESIHELDVSFKPIYHWKLHVPTTQPGIAADLSSARLGVVRALALLVRTADAAAVKAAEDVGSDQDQTLRWLRDTIVAAQATAQESLFTASQSAEMPPADVQLVKEALAMTKRMALICKNITESYKLAMEGDAAQDEQRKLTFRGKLQESLLIFAAVTRDLDAEVTKLSTAWGIKGQVGVASQDTPALGNAAPAAVESRLTVPPAVPGSVVPTTPPAVTPASTTPLPADFTSPAKKLVARLTAAPTRARRQIGAEEDLKGDLLLTPEEGPYEVIKALGIAKGAVLEHTPIHISTSPGTEVQGGQIESGDRWVLRLKGDAARPTIFRNVKFTQYIGGYCGADYCIFDHCEFRKGGPYFSRDGLTTRWKFHNCAFNECTWKDMSWLDYGVSFTDCTFANMNFPDLGFNAPKNKPRDMMSSYRTEYRTINRCTFEGCRLPQDMFWCSEGCNYLRCSFEGTNAFESDKATEVFAYVAETRGARPDELLTQHPAARAPITIRYSPHLLPAFWFDGK